MFIKRIIIHTGGFFPVKVTFNSGFFNKISKQQRLCLNVILVLMDTASTPSSQGSHRQGWCAYEI